MATQVLLLEDVEALGRSGEIVNVKPGFMRNFLLPQGLAILANERALNLQKKLQEERAKRAIVDKREADELAARIEGKTLTKIVKVDHDGHMYGSVSASDLIHLFQDEYKIALEKKNIALKHPIKTTGIHVIGVKLNEGVMTSFTLKVMSEESAKAAASEEAQA